MPDFPTESLLGRLSQAIDRPTVSRISNEIGAEESKTESAIAAALPVLVGALAQNAKSSSGASALAGALDRDHDGSVLDDLAGFLGQGKAQGMGQAILGHVLGGGQQKNAQQAIGRSTGLDGGQVTQLLALLAPIVMSFLGQQKKRQGLDAEGLSSLLGSERERVERAQPGQQDVLSKILDQDGDGDVGDDLVNLGGKLLGGFLSRR